MELLFSKIIEAKSIRLWTGASNRAEYERLRRVIGKDVKNVLDDEKISEALLANSIKSLAGKGDLILLHDPSDIRKMYSKKLEDLGKVRTLKSDIINGYSSFNTVAVDVSEKKLTLLATEIYSNRSAEHVSQEELKRQEKGCPESATEEERRRYEEVKERIAEEDYINLSRITRTQLKKVSEQLKAEEGVGTLTHVLDRGFDDGGLFPFIDKELEDKFVIRLKLSRSSEEIEIDNDGKKRRIKLHAQTFQHNHVRDYQKILIKNKAYQDVKCVLEFGNKLDEYNVVKVQLINRDGNPIFKQPMLLVSNHEVTNGEQAFAVYRIYLKRSKIEGVFKFLKEVLGWEEFQIRDFESIKTLLTFCYFVAGYFYEIESVLIQQDFIKFVAALGGGKGKITRNYILRGFSKMFVKITVDSLMEEHAITPEKFQEILKWARMSGGLI